MNPWLQFLSRQGARLDAGQTPQVTGFDGAEEGGSAAAYVAPLTELGLIAANGEEAAGFLHNQLTNDIVHLDADQARLAGYCSPKGRLLASFLVWKSAGTIMLQLPRQIQAPIQKRLQMFILRSKVKLIDASDDYAVLGLGGEAAVQTLEKWFPELPATPYAKVDGEAGTLIRVADALGVPRFQWIATLANAEQAWPDLRSKLTPVGSSVWRLAEIRAGVPQITPATQEQFVPQMINFELLGGVNFKKGCYPGQEIVARTQYLGKLKRRMLPASIAEANVQAGMEIFSSADPDQPCGMIVNAEPAPEGGSDCLVEVKMAAAESAIHLGSASGPLLRFGTLPYSLSD